MDQGRGIRFKVGLTGAEIPSSGRTDPATDLTLAFDVHRFDNQVDSVAVTVTAEMVADNSNVNELAADLNAALVSFFNENLAELEFVDDVPPVEVQVVDGHLRLVAQQQRINGLEITSATSTFLGLTIGAQSEEADLVFHLRDGSSFEANLDFSETLGDVAQRITDAAGGPSRLTVEDVEDRLKLVDQTTAAGDNTFRILAAGDDAGFSAAGTTLQILGEVVGSEDNPATPADESNGGDTRLGEPLFAGVSLDQFFFDVSKSRIYANVAIAADDIDLVAAMGILELGLKNGTIIGDAIKAELQLPDEAFELTLDFIDADSNQAGLQAAAIVGLEIAKSLTETFEFDLNLPDFGPVTVESGGEIDFTVGGQLNLDFGFRFDSFTPYLMNSTSVSLAAGIDSQLGLSAGIGGISGDLTERLQLRGGKTEPVPPISHHFCA